MYHAFVRQRLRGIFRGLSAGEYKPLLTGFGTRFEHTFPGDHPLGGTRHTVASMEAWFARLYRLFPRLSFEVKTVVVSGWPWDTVAVVEWVDRATPVDGVPYVNEGMHIVELRWGRVVRLRAYLDTSKSEAACQRLARAGITEAAAAPITDT